MYSKAGKATYEAFTVLQHAQDILEPKTLKVKSNYVPKSMDTGDKLAELAAKRFGQNNIMKDLAGIADSDDTAANIESLSKSVSSKHLRKFEPFGQAVSRDQREKVMSYKVVSSNAAYYAPKYERVEKKSLAMVDYSKSSAKRLFDEIILSTQATSPNSQSHIILPPIADKLKERVRGGVIPLEFQIGRPDIIEEAKKRKVCVTDALPNPDLPNSLTTSQHLPRIKFSRSLSRKDLIIETGGANCPIYDVNHEFVKRSLGKVGPKLEKVIGRKDDVQQPYYTLGEVYEYDDYVKNNKSSIYPKVNSPVFNKMAPREKNPDSKYPAYLQSMHSGLNESAITAQRKSPRSINASMFNSIVVNSGV